MADLAPELGLRSVIAVVASAGGIDAVSRVLGGLHAGLPAAVLVAIHQHPDHESKLPEILGRCTVLPVAPAEDGAPLLPGRVLVAPPGEHLVVTPDARVGLVRAGAKPPARPSADLLFTTLAVSMRERAIAVVLSGAGHDGATGATAVHHFGGLVLASDEASSAVFSMPKATIDRDSAIDYVDDVDRLGELLMTLASGRVVAT